MTYLVSLKQLKQILHIEKKENNDSFPSCLYFTTTIITMHSIQFFLLKGIVTPHLGPNVLTLNVLYDLLKTWRVEQWSHVKDIWFAFAALLWPFYVWSVCVPEEALGLKHSPNPLYPWFPTSYYPHGSACSVFVLCDDRPVSPGRATPPTCTPSLRYQAAFPSLSWRLPASVRTSLSDLLYLSHLSVDYEDPLTRSLSGSLCIMSSSSLLWLFIHSNFSPLFNPSSLSRSFLVLSFSPFSPSSPVGPLFSLSKMPFSSPLLLYPCSWEELETICCVY